MQSFCKAKDTVNRTKWQPTDWENIFTSDRGLISNIYKELNKLDSREPNSPIKNDVQSTAAAAAGPAEGPSAVDPR